MKDKYVFFDQLGVEPLAYIGGSFTEEIPVENAVHKNQSTFIGKIENELKVLNAIHRNLVNQSDYSYHVATLYSAKHKQLVFGEEKIYIDIPVSNVIHRLFTTDVNLTYPLELKSAIHKHIAYMDFPNIPVQVHNAIHKHYVYNKINAPVVPVCDTYLNTPYESRYLETEEESRVLETPAESRYLATLFDC